MTLLARTQHLLAHANPGGELLARDPYDGDAGSGRPGDAPAATADARRFGNLRRGDLAGAWRSVRRRLARRREPAAAAGVTIADERTVAQLQAIASLVGGLDGAAERRQQAQARRRVPDRELFAQFPPWLVPTYPGDEALFAAPGFRALLPADVPLVEATLAEVMRWP
jgi:hypothetical protein